MTTMKRPKLKTYFWTIVHFLLFLFLLFFTRFCFSLVLFGNLIALLSCFLTLFSFVPCTLHQFSLHFPFLLSFKDLFGGGSLLACFPVPWRTFQVVRVRCFHSRIQDMPLCKGLSVGIKTFSVVLIFCVATLKNRNEEWLAIVNP